MKDEAELLAAIRGGAVDEFAELVARHQDAVFAILGRYERNPHTIEDLAQEAFLKAWRALDRFDGRVPFAHWLARITTRVALDHLRRRRRQPPQLELETLGHEALDWLRAESPAGEPAAEAARVLLDQALQQLSAEEQLVLTLLELEDRTVQETAQLTGWSSVWVRVRAHRARRKLARILTQLRGPSP